MANIYMSMGQKDQAQKFYISTLELQSSFEPAIERLMAILCDMQNKPIAMGTTDKIRGL